MATTAKPLAGASVVTVPSRWDDFRRMMGNALIITRREVRDSFRDWRILAPIVILTFLFPFLAQFVAGQFSDFVTQYGAQIVGERTIPFLLMIVGFFPISISLVIALETFVGEKERRSLEPLLSTPLTNTELYIGKTLAAMIPPLLSSYGGMLVYLTSLLFGELAWRPQPLLVIQIMLLTGVQALVMVTGAVVVSSQTTSTRAANLLASFIIIPMTLAIQGESAIMFLAPDAESPRGIGALWVIIVGLCVVVVLLLRVGNSIFNREELLGRTIDQLNIRGFASKLWHYIRAVDEKGKPARNLIEWYRYGVWMSLRRLGAAVPITVAVFVLTFAAGFIVGQLPQWQLNLPSDIDLAGVGTDFGSLLSIPTQTNTLMFIVWQNGRILLAALILSIFTFGSASLVITPPVYFILGYIYSQILHAGYDPAFFYVGILTHGVVEIPVIVIATAAALRLGAVVTKLPPGQTVGYAWTLALADTARITLGVIIPGLIVAACIESFITPQLVVAVLGG